MAVEYQGQVMDPLNPPGAPKIDDSAYSYDWKQQIPVPPSALPPGTQKQKTDDQGPKPEGMVLPEELPTNEGAPAFQSGEAAAGNKPSKWEAWGQTISQKLDRGTIGEIANHFEEQHLQNEDSRDGVAKISPEEANRRAPGFPEPYNTPMDPRVVDMQYAQYQKSQREKEWIDRAGPLPWGADFAAGIVAGAIDPANIALGSLTGGAMDLAGVARGIGRVFAENAVLNTGLGAFSYMQDKYDRLNPSVGDTVVGGIASTIGMTGFHWALGRALEAAKTGLDFIRQTPEDIQAESLRRTVAQEEAGVKTDASPSIAEARAVQAGALEGQNSPFRAPFSPVEHPSERPYYIGKTGNGNPVSMADLGPGTQAIDNPFTMNHMAASGEAPGKFGRIDIPEDTKLLDLEKPLPKELVDQAKAELEKAGIGDDLLPKKQLEEMPGKDVLTLMRGIPTPEDYPGAEKLLQARIQGEGYEGYKFIHADAETGSPLSNGVHLFQENALPSEQYVASKEAVPSLPSDQKQALTEQSLSPENNKYSTPEIQKEAHDLKHGPGINATPEYMDPIIEEQTKNAQAILDKFAENDPELKKELESIKRDNMIEDRQNRVLKDLADCVGEAMA